MKKNKSKQKAALFLFDNVRLMYLLAGVVALVALGLTVWFITQHIITKPQTNVIVGLGAENDTELNHVDCNIYHPLTGECTEQNEKFPVVAVMVENHINAQPLSGIAEASIVYEAPVEGGIPRLLVIYPVSSSVEKVGPVRSARPYYLDWVSEYENAMYMHVGGSPEALEKIKQFKLFDLNEFSRGVYYWRSKDRFAPHNVYTSSKLWQSAHNRYAASSSDYFVDSWSFGKMEVCETDCVSKISLSYGQGLYNPMWEYNKEKNNFERYQFNRRHRDANGTPYIADTLLVMMVEAKVLDNVGRLGINTQAGGEGYVLRDGFAIPATWQKNNRTARTKWFDNNGTEIVLKPGKIWVQVISQVNGVDIKTE